MVAWSDAEKAFVRERWPTGAFAHDIARALTREHGVRRSRQAVIGIAHRLELGPHPLTLEPRPEARKRSGIAARGGYVLRAPKKAKYMEKPSPVASLAVRLIDLRADQCHAVTDATPWEQRFCGHPVVHSDRPYCAAHRALFFQPSKARSA